MADKNLSDEPAIYLSQRYIPHNVTLKTQKRIAFYYNQCLPSAIKIKLLV